MELEDGAYDLIERIDATTDQIAAFRDTQYAILVGSKPRVQGMERSELLAANAKIFES